MPEITPQLDEPQDVVTALVDKARELGVRVGDYEATVLAARVVAVARPVIERQVREDVAEQMRALAGQIGSARSLGMEAAAETLRELADRIARGES